MFTRSRHVIAVLLLLALPLQSIAASAMLLCKMVHASESVPTSANGLHDHMAHQSLVAGEAPESQQGHIEKKPSAHQCSACMVCSGFLALPSASSMVTARPASHQYLQVQFTAPMQLHLQGPKRPPRLHLA
jgi:hypothetical protein